MFRRLIQGIAACLCVIQAAELPVREVILFKHGVGFFSRAGELKAGETARLDFKASDMNDVLKSLTVEQKGGGKIAGLRYDSSESLDKKLEEFSFEIGEHFALSAVLDQMKGARIELKYGNDPVSGQIVSGREMSDSANRGKEQLVVLLDTGEMRTLDLGAATGIRFLDSVVQRQFADYLRVVAQARSKEKRSVYLDSTSTAARELTASYMIPFPVWKSSYRLMAATAGTTLEGWAIVDNTTDEDWSNVQLALVSGRPISFISQLYEPKYKQRLAAELEEDGAVAPATYSYSLLQGAPGVASFPASKFPKPAQMTPNADLMYEQMGMSSKTDRLIPSTVNIRTQAREAGELFEYRFSSGVTVKKGESAMLPFLQQKLDTRKLVVYSEALGIHPRNAMEISNSTGKTLDGGPITVYDGGSYAGEALMETLKTGDKRLISYAIDLGTRVTTKLNSDVNFAGHMTAKNGVVRTRLTVAATRTYTIRNIDASAKTLIIEHPIRSEYKLVGVKPSETTNSVYRFEKRLDAKSTAEFVVHEETVREDMQSVSTLTPTVITGFISGRSMSDAGKRQLAAISERKGLLVTTDREIADLDLQIGELGSDQGRLRENIASLNVVSGQQEQVQRYSRQLAEGEAKLMALRDQQREARKRKQALEAEVAELIGKLEF